MLEGNRGKARAAADDKCDGSLAENGGSTRTHVTSLQFHSPQNVCSLKSTTPLSKVVRSCSCSHLEIDHTTRINASERFF